MKRMMKYLLPCAAMLMLAACKHKELCYNHSHVVSLKVIFDWSEAPDATPASMSLYLFPKGEDEALRYEFTDRNGGTISVPFGSYDAICLNSDTEGIVYRNTERYETFEVTTQTTDLLVSSVDGLGVGTDNVSRAEGTEDQRVALSPDKLWTGTKEDIVLTELETESEITLFPKQSFRTCRVEITDVENLEYVSGISAVISNQHGGYLPALDEYSDEMVSHPFELQAGADGTTVEGEYLFFHHCDDPDEGIVHPLVLHAVMSDGSIYTHTFDTDEVTRQLHEDHDHHAYEVVLRFSGLSLPTIIPGSGGFESSVDEWQDVNIDINM